MYPLIPPTTGLEGGLQLTVKDEGGPELENVVTTGPGAEGTTVYSIVVQYIIVIREKCTKVIIICFMGMVNFHNKVFTPTNNTIYGTTA